MEDNANQFEALAESTAEYAKTSYELGKLKVVDKISDTLSSLIPKSIVISIIMMFLLFCSFGIAFWVGDILGEAYLGFSVVAAFYGVLGIIMILMHKWLKSNIYNKIIRQLLK
jgi:hypothetical protein